jgi:2',3'-cyclic-nucleotide 2'-phosphodiesterase (5'-nucleotidase family)
LPNTFAGSFLLVSGIKYYYDYRKNPRVQTVFVAGEALDINRMYTVSTFSYLSTGGDGFGMMKDCKFVVDQVSGIDLLTLLLRFFKESEAADFIKN